jgi:hypothetical protein
MFDNIKLESNLLSGTVNVKDLSLKPEFLDKYINLPLKLVFSHIGQLSLKIDSYIKL